MTIDDRGVQAPLAPPRIGSAPAWTVRGAVVASLILSSGVTLAAESVRVAVIHNKEDEPSRRIRAELGAAGLEAVDATVPAGDARNAAAVARDENAVGAVRIVSPDEVELVIVETESTAVLYDKVVRSSGSPGDSLAVRAVEDLRARLVKLRLVEPTPRDEAPPPVEAPASRSGPADHDGGTRAGAPPERRSLWATGAFGATASTGGLGGDIAARVGLRFDATDRFGGSLSALLPLVPQTVSAAGAHAEVNVYAVSALFHYALVDGGQWGADVGGGAGVVIAKMEGFSESPVYVGRSETLVAGAPLLDASLNYRPISMLRVRGELMAGVTLPRLAVAFDQRDVAVWGRPFAVALLGAEIALSSEREREETP